MAGAIARSRIELLNAIIGPVVGTVAGGEWKGHSVAGGRPSARSTSAPNTRTFRAADHATPEAKEDGLLNALQRAGVRIR